MASRKKLNKIIFHYKNIDIDKTVVTPFVKPGFSVVKFWALRTKEY